MGVSLWTRDQIAARILAGETLVILRDKVIRVPQSWLDAHPGGALAILHYVGRDATDEVDAFHSDETLQKIQRYAIGTVEVSEHGWKSFVPPVMMGWVRKKGKDGQMQWYNEAAPVRSGVNTELSPASQILLVEREPSQEHAAPTLNDITPIPAPISPEQEAKRSVAYKELHQRITDAGLYNTPYLTGYGPEIARYTLFAVTSAIAYHYSWFITSAFFLGLFWHQVTFTVHDLGHVGVTHNWTIDRLIAIFIADFMGGLSVGWWVINHNTHHLVTNHPTHDPDIQHLPFFAISPALLTNLWSSYYKRIMKFDAAAKIFISVQHKLFYIVMSLARFNLYALSYGFLAKTAFEKPRARGGRWWWWAEVFSIGLFYCWYGSVLKGCGSWKTTLGYLLVSNMVPSPLHVQIVLSHFSRSTADLGPGESFPARQLRTSVDVICDPSIEWIHGGLHLQVTHHLFPRLPRHNLRKASLYVKEYAKEHNMEYAEFGFFEGNSEVRGVLRQVAEQVKIVGMVADAEIRDRLVK